MSGIIGGMERATAINVSVTRRTLFRTCGIIMLGAAMAPLLGHDSAAVADDSILGSSPVVWRRGDDGGWDSNVGTSVAASDATFGVDVSQHDGRLDWGALRDAGISFAIVRCGFGTDVTGYDDERFIENVNGCEDAGIPYGIYLYSYAYGTDNAASEAEHALRQARRCTPSLGIWYDIEEPKQGTAIGWEPSAFADIIGTFVDRVGEEYGDVPVGVYASRSYLDRYLTDPSIDGLPIWMAQWAGQPSGMPDTGVMWQAGSCVVSGAEYPLDFDVHFTGSGTVGQSDAFTATDDIAALEGKLSSMQDSLANARRQLAMAVSDGYKDRRAGTAIASLLDSDSITDAIKAANGERRVADEIVAMQGSVADTQSAIEALQAMIGGQGSR